jgi:hypothetical protein
VGPPYCVYHGCSDGIGGSGLGIELVARSTKVAGLDNWAWRRKVNTCRAFKKRHDLQHRPNYKYLTITFTSYAKVLIDALVSRRKELGKCKVQLQQVWTTRSITTRHKKTALYKYLD